MTLLHNKEFKYKPGDLVQPCKKKYRCYFGLGIIIATEQSDFGPAYYIFWTKIGFDWQYEEYPEKVSK